MFFFFFFCVCRWILVLRKLEWSCADARRREGLSTAKVLQTRARSEEEQRRHRQGFSQPVHYSFVNFLHGKKCCNEFLIDDSYLLYVVGVVKLIVDVGGGGDGDIEIQCKYTIGD